MVSGSGPGPQAHAQQPSTTNTDSVASALDLDNASIPRYGSGNNPPHATASAIWTSRHLDNDLTDLYPPQPSFDHNVRLAQRLTDELPGHPVRSSETRIAGVGDLPKFPILARSSDSDPLVQGIAAIDPHLGSTLYSLLKQPISNRPDSVGAPSCRSVRGVGGVMLQPLPLPHVDITTSLSADLNMKPPASIKPTQFVQSPTSLQSPLTAGLSPIDSRRPSLQDVTQPNSPTSAKAPKQGQDGFKTEFRFVVNEDARTARNTVRQHVMREFRRRERWEQGRNKVSKAKKPSKKEPKAIKREPSTPTLPQAPPESTASTPLTSSFRISPIVRRESVVSGENGRRNSTGMSTSDRSDSCDTEADRFMAAIMQGHSSQSMLAPAPAPLPFAPYAQHGVILRPQDVEDAVEEIERSQLHHFPYREDPWAEVARASINPFSLHIDLGASAASKLLLHHYARVMPSLMDEVVTGTVFHRIGWLYSSVAIHDPTPFHTIAGFTLGHIAMLRGQDEPASAIEHKEKSLQLIHRRLANPMEAASDGSIGAIANIASYELIDCNAAKFSIHMRGLARLVRDRGGISDFSANPQLETVLIRLDVIRAYVTISQPRFPMWASVRDLTPLAINVGPPSSEWFCAPAEYQSHQYLFCEEMIKVIHGMEDVLSLMRSLNPTIPFTPDPTFSAHLMSLVLSHLRRNILDAPSDYANRTCRRVIRLAALVLLDIAAAEFFQPPQEPKSSHTDSGPPPERSRSTIPGGNMNTDQPERQPGSAKAPSDKKGLGLALLRERFPSLELNRHTWGRSVEMIVAVLMQAERMALERPFRAWYVADIVTMTMKLGEESWQAVERAIVGDIVNSVSREQTTRHLWAQGGHLEEGQDNPNALPAWDMGEMVRLFWADWNNSTETQQSMAIGGYLQRT